MMTNKYVEFAIHEFREIIPPTIFFAIGFNLGSPAKTVGGSG